MTKIAGYLIICFIVAFATKAATQSENASQNTLPDIRISYNTSLNNTNRGHPFLRMAVKNGEKISFGIIFEGNSRNVCCSLWNENDGFIADYDNKDEIDFLKSIGYSLIYTSPISIEFGNRIFLSKNIMPGSAKCSTPLSEYFTLARPEKSPIQFYIVHFDKSQKFKIDSCHLNSDYLDIGDKNTNIASVYTQIIPGGSDVAYILSGSNNFLASIRQSEIKIISPGSDVYLIDISNVYSAITCQTESCVAALSVHQ